MSLLEIPQMSILEIPLRPFLLEIPLRLSLLEIPLRPNCCRQRSSWR
jgi:hypothetical protein